MPVRTQDVSAIHLYIYLLICLYICYSHLILVTPIFMTNEPMLIHYGLIEQSSPHPESSLCDSTHNTYISLLHLFCLYLFYTNLLH